MKHEDTPVGSSDSEHTISTLECVDLEGAVHQVPLDQLYWRPSAYGIVMHGPKILLCRHFGKYNLPGGGIDFGERLEEGLAREVYEETGIVLKQPRLVAATSDLYQPPFGTAFQSVLLYYACEYAGGLLSTQGFTKEEKTYAEMPEWVDLSSIDSWEVIGTTDFRPFIKQVIADRDN